MANLLIPMVPNQDFRSEFFNTTIDNMHSVAYQTSDISVTSQATSFQLATDLILPDLVADAEYIFESCLFYDTSATADINIRIRLPFIGAILIAPWSSGTAITTATNNINQQGQGSTSSSTVEMIAGGVAAGTVMSIRPTGWIRMFTSSGDLAIDFMQSVSSATSTILKQGSWIALTRVK